MEITIYNFSKKVNSTAIPGEGVEDIVLEGVVKTPFDLVHPSVDFNLPITSIIPAYFNYAYIPFLRRYYNITTWVWSGRLWHAEMTCDVLASFKTDIGNSKEYVIRAASKHNEYLIDNALPTSAKSTLRYSFNTHTEGYNWTGNYQEGSFVVGIINSDTNSIGAVSYYKFTVDQLRSLCYLLLTDPSYLDIEDLSQGLQKALVNPWQYIVSCMWFPFDVAAGAEVSSIKIGWWHFDVSAYRLFYTGFSVSDLEFTVLKHPKTNINGKYCNMSPFSEYTLFIPGFGAFDIPPAYLVDSDTITCRIVVDSISGVGTLSVSTSGNQICVRESQIGVSIQLASISTTGVGATIADIGARIISGDGGPRNDGGAAGIISRALLGYAAPSTNVSTISSNGTLSRYHFTPHLKCLFLDQPAVPSAEIGRPLCEYVVISTLSGYVQCAHGEINTTATEAEKEMIKNFLEGGFYYA